MYGADDGQMDSLKTFESQRIGLLKQELAEIQKKTFTKWCNAHLKQSRSKMEIRDLFSDLSNGTLLMILLEQITGEKIGRPNGGRLRVQKMENVNRALNFVQSKVRLEGIGPEDVVDKNPTLILGLIWTIILRFQIQPIEMVEEEETKEKRSAKEALLLWCQRRTQTYPNIDITNFTTSWRNGLAFCALIHSHNPNLLDYQKLEERNELQNLRLAFNTAEQHLGIAKILDEEDIAVDRPDDKVVMTYVTQLLNAQFVNYRKTERRQYLDEKGELESLFYRITTTLVANNMRHYDPPIDLSLSSIENWWRQLEKLESEKERKLKDEIIRLQRLEWTAETFERKARIREAWLNEMGLLLEKTTNNIDFNLHSIENQMKRFEGFSTNIECGEKRITALAQLCERLRLENYYDTLIIQRRNQDIQKKWQRLSQQTYNINKNLSTMSELHLLFQGMQQMQHEIEKYQPFISVDATAQANGRHLIGCSHLLQRHQFLIVNIRGMETSLKSLHRRAQPHMRILGVDVNKSQIDEKELEIASDVKKRMDDLDSMYDQLHNATKYREDILLGYRYIFFQMEQSSELIDWLSGRYDMLSDLYKSTFGHMFFLRRKNFDQVIIAISVHQRTDEEYRVRATKMNEIYNNMKCILKPDDDSDEIFQERSSMIDDIRFQRSSKDNYRRAGSIVVDYGMNDAGNEDMNQGRQFAMKLFQTADHTVVDTKNLFERRWNDLNRLMNSLKCLSSGNKEKLLLLKRFVKFVHECEENEKLIKEKLMLFQSTSTSITDHRHIQMKETMELFSIEIGRLNENCVKLENDLNGFRTEFENDSKTLENLNNLNSSNINKNEVEVLFTYSKGKGMPVKKGERLTLIKKTNDDWWLVEKSDRSRGYVPANYVKEFEKSTNLNEMSGNYSDNFNEKLIGAMRNHLKECDDLYDQLTVLTTEYVKKVEWTNMWNDYRSNVEQLMNWCDYNENILNDAESILNIIHQRHQQFRLFLQEFHQHKIVYLKLNEQFQKQLAGQLKTEETMSNKLVNVRLVESWTRIEKLYQQLQQYFENFELIEQFNSKYSEMDNWLMEKINTMEKEIDELVSHDIPSGKLTSRTISSLSNRCSVVEKELTEMGKGIEKLHENGRLLGESLYQENSIIDSRLNHIDSLNDELSRLIEQQNMNLEKRRGYGQLMQEAEDLLRSYEEVFENLNELISTNPQDIKETQRRLDDFHEKVENNLNLCNLKHKEFLQITERLEKKLNTIPSNEKIPEDQQISARKLENEMSELHQLQKEIGRRMKKGKEFLEDFYRLHTFDKNITELNVKSSEHENFLLYENLGTTLDECVTLLRRHHDFQHKLTSQDNRISQILDKDAEELISSAHSSSNQIIQKRNDFIKRRKKILMNADEREHALLQTRTFYEWKQLTLEFEHSLTEKRDDITVIVSNYMTHGHEQTLNNFDRKLQRLSAIEHEMNANEQELNNIHDSGTKLIRSQNRWEKDVRQIIRAMHEHWTQLCHEICIERDSLVRQRSKLDSTMALAHVDNRIERLRGLLLNSKTRLTSQSKLSLKSDDSDNVSDTITNIHLLRKQDDGLRHIADQLAVEKETLEKQISDGSLNNVETYLMKLNDLHPLLQQKKKQLDNNLKFHELMQTMEEKKFWIN
ncbi:hypothetical protein SNEBB_000251 [Seison nebaliae]|nr:hypothetical protein SNEBB_000251 [Seison nebaliae]